jgi:hypothetical protein
MSKVFLNGCMPAGLVLEPTRDTSYALEGGLANMILLVVTMFLLPLGLVAMYLYVSGAFTKNALNL